MSTLLTLKYLLPVGSAAFGWGFQFIGIAISQANLAAITTLSNKNFLSFSWFSLVLNLSLILASAYSLHTNSLVYIKQALTSFLIIAEAILLTNLDSLFYGQGAANGLLAFGSFFVCAGFTLLLVLFGSDEENTTIHSFLSSGTDENGGGGFKMSLPKLTKLKNSHQETPAYYNPSPEQIYDASVDVPRMSVGEGNGARNDALVDVPRMSVGEGNGARNLSFQALPVVVNETTRNNEGFVAGAEVKVVRATALYPYSANPSDPHEISFLKGEKLEILDSKGKWWKVKKVGDDGSVAVGIAPSNYLQLL